MFKQSTGKELEYTPTGKPFPAMFACARRTLDRRHLELSREDGAEASPDLSAIYMIGDNPKSDIRGANRAGGPWRSVLVRTGVFEGPEGSEKELPVEQRPTVVQAGVLEAVKWLLGQEGILC